MTDQTNTSHDEPRHPPLPTHPAARDLPPLDIPPTEKGSEGEPEAADLPQDGADSEGSAPREESKLRKRAQAAETERDALAGQLAEARREIARLAVEAAGINPNVLRLVDVTEHITSDGLDRDGLLKACAATSAELGLPRTPRPDPAQGRTSSGPLPAGFADAFKPRGGQ